MSFTVRVDDHEVVAALNKLGNLGKAAELEMAATAGALVISNEAKRLVRKLSGNLARSISVSTVQRSPNLVRVSVGTNVVYAKMVEYGGVIVPRNKRFLAWQAPSGEWIFARRVVQPARPYMRPAFDSKSAQARAVAFQALTKLVGLS